MICRAPAASTSRARSTVRMPPPTRHDKGRRDLADDGEVVALAHRGVEIDHLHLGKALEPPHPPEDVVVSDGEALALDELNDGAALKIDRRNQHHGRRDSRGRHRYAVVCLQVSV